MKITKWTEDVINYNKVPAAFQNLVPDRLFPVIVSFELSGADINNAVCNAIRRTIACELPVWAMHVNYEDIKTTDPFIIPEMIQQRLTLIPIDQSIDKSSVFSISVVNNTEETLDIKTGEMTTSLKRLPFNSTFTLVSIQPGTTFEIKNIKLKQDFSYVDGLAGHSLAHHCSSVALDVDPLNTYEGTGIPSRESNPLHWKISFRTSGTMSPKDIVRQACENIIERVKMVGNALDDMQTNGTTYVLVIDNESHTIGNLFTKTICDLFPNIGLITYRQHPTERTITIQCRCDDDINIVFQAAIDHLEKLFTKIATSI